MAYSYEGNVFDVVVGRHCRCGDGWSALGVGCEVFDCLVLFCLRGRTDLLVITLPMNYKMFRVPFPRAGWDTRPASTCSAQHNSPSPNRWMEKLPRHDLLSKISDSGSIQSAFSTHIIFGSFQNVIAPCLVRDEKMESLRSFGLLRSSG